MSRAFATQHYVVATILILAITVANITGCHDPDTGANIETTSHTSDPQGVLVEQTEVPRV
jgi:hypothetical protein